MRRSRRRLAGLGLAACLGALAPACGARSVSPDVVPAPVAAADCALIDEPGASIATVALEDPVDPAHAPWPTNDSERLVFRQLYETLVYADCDRRLHPGLAASWRLEADRRTWLVTLRDDARFSDGTRLTAADVVSSWAGATGSGTRSAPGARHLAAVRALDDRTLAIALYHEAADAPFFLADARYAVARRASGAGWPLGTRQVRVVPDPDPDARRPRIVLAAVDGAAGTIAPAAHLEFVVAPGRDPRDFLDAGVDLLVTRDPAALRYAATLPHLRILPLGWHRTYVLMAPGRDGPASSLPAAARQALADEAVRGEARGAEGPFWWETSEACAVPEPGRPREPALARVVYERRDQVARDLAERIVGLANMTGAEARALVRLLLPGADLRPPQAIGLEGEVLASAHAAGADAGYVVALARRPLDACQDLRALAGRLAWLDAGGIVALVDTRLHAIVRRGHSGLIADGDGGLVVMGGGGEVRE